MGLTQINAKESRNDDGVGGKGKRADDTNLKKSLERGLGTE